MHQTWTVWLFGNDLHACRCMLSGLDRTAACTLMTVRSPNLWMKIECVGYHCILKMYILILSSFLGNHTCNARQFSAYFVACDFMDLQVNMLWCQWDVGCSVFGVISCQPATSVVFAGDFALRRAFYEQTWWRMHHAAFIVHGLVAQTFFKAFGL